MCERKRERVKGRKRRRRRRRRRRKGTSLPLKTDLTLVSTNKLFIRKPILNAYKTHQKLHTLALAYSLI